jgi:phenylacetate-CoA ligase
LAKVLLTNEHTSHISVFDIEENNMLNILKNLNKANPDYIESYSSAIVELANGLKKLNLNAPSNLKTIISTSDTLLSSQKKLIEEQFKCNVVNRYGSREFTGSVAQVCPDNDDLFHVNTEFVFLEVVNEEGKQVAPGERGKILITDYNNYVMPFIRYDMGDIAIIGEECSCGRGFITLKNIEGRSTEQIKLIGGKNISPGLLGHFIFIINDYTKYIKEYQAIQHKKNKIEFIVVPEEIFDENIELKLKNTLNYLFGNDVTILITQTDRIQREASGKRLIIKSKC